VFEDSVSSVVVIVVFISATSSVSNNRVYFQSMLYLQPSVTLF